MGYKAYKAFNYDFTCRDFQYEIGKTYELVGKLAICENGFHFCERLKDVFMYYDFMPRTRVAEVEILGNVITDFNKSCTDKIKIVRELSLKEQLKIMNINYDTYKIGMLIYNILKSYDNCSDAVWRSNFIGNARYSGLTTGPLYWSIDIISSFSNFNIGEVLFDDFVLRIKKHNGNAKYINAKYINLSNKAEAKKQIVNYLNTINESENKIFFSILSRIYQELEVI